MTIQRIDVGDVIDAAPWSAFQRWCVVLAASGIVIDGVATQIFGLAIPAMIVEWGIPRSAFAIPTALGFLGMALGAFAAGIAGDKMGRRWPLILSVAIFGSMTLLTALATNIIAVAALRFLAGLGLGGALPNAASLIADITPRRHRVLAISLGGVGMPAGSFLCGGLAAVVLPGAGWRTLFVIGGTASLVVAVLFVLFLVESPRILSRDASRRVKLAGLLSRMNIAVDPDALTPAVEQERGKGSKSALLSPEFRRDTLALWAAFTATMLALYTVISWAPTLIAQRGFPIEVTGKAMAAFGFGSILGGFALAWIVARYGSRGPLAATTCLGMFSALFLVVHGVNPADGTGILITAFVVLGFTIAGVQNLMFALSAHIYPVSLRSSGLGTSLAVGRIGAVASAFVGAVALADRDGRAFFVVIAAVFALILAALLSFSKPIPKSIG